jgi:hypothetical protein
MKTETKYAKGWGFGYTTQQQWMDSNIKKAEFVPAPSAYPAEKIISSFK